MAKHHAHGLSDEILSEVEELKNTYTVTKKKEPTETNKWRSNLKDSISELDESRKQKINVEVKRSFVLNFTEEERLKLLNDQRINELEEGIISYTGKIVRW